MRPHRREKIESLIQEEIGKILERDVEFDGAFVTVTGVEVSEDLLQAKIKLSVIPDEKAVEVFKLLEARKRNFQHQLLKKMNIKPMPQIKFEIAQSYGQVAKE